MFMLLLNLSLPLSSFAETVYLNSGEVIRGSVGEINDDGMMVTHDSGVDFYSHDEIDSVFGLAPDKKAYYERVSAPEYQEAVAKARLTGEKVEIVEDEYGQQKVEIKGPSAARKEWQAQMQELAAAKAFRYVLVGIGILFVVVWVIAAR